eukprot:TRINITY_DN2038_c0_g1_i9.p3 TRINITY_DN2038_c0_g1~~TRINITY_DN2038_c0_g1_i9.p3  ORF type:complete len:231 (+),score=-7.81 TRINITY_DN2038_c0_g1_i9:361-1053(+)
MSAQKIYKQFINTLRLLKFSKQLIIIQTTHSHPLYKSKISALKNLQRQLVHQSSQNNSSQFKQLIHTDQVVQDLLLYFFQTQQVHKKSSKKARHNSDGLSTDNKIMQKYSYSSQQHSHQNRFSLTSSPLFHFFGTQMDIALSPGNQNLNSLLSLLEFLSTFPKLQKIKQTSNQKNWENKQRNRFESKLPKLLKSFVQSKQIRKPKNSINLNYIIFKISQKVFPEIVPILA